MTRSKVRGTMLGLAIGDALGKAVEGWPIKRIQETYGRVTEYKSCAGHTIFNDHALGTTTDDTAFSFAIMEAILEAGKIDMDAIAKHHVKKADVAGGMGATTKEAILRLAAGVHWSDSGKTDVPKRGGGNGVAMKMAPVALYYAAHRSDKEVLDTLVSKVTDIAYMTHPNPLGAASGFALTTALTYLLSKEVNQYDEDRMVDGVCFITALGDNKLPVEEQLTPKIRYAQSIKDKEEMLVSELKGGFSINESIPFTLGFFWRNPYSIEGLYDVASAGGDTDSNASMVGSMLGALHGEEIFPEHLVKGLVERQEAISLADKFYDKFCTQKK